MVLLRCTGVLAPMAPWPLDIDAATARDAIRGVAAQIPAFRREVAAGRWYLMRDGIPLSMDMIDLPPGQELLLVPEAEGAEGKTGAYAMIGIGVVLIGASLMVPGSTALVAAGYSASFASAAATASTVAFSIGVSLALTGVSQLLAPDPSAPEKNDASTLFGGSINTTASDAAVPVVFGRTRAGSIVGSFGQTTIEQR